MRSGDSTRENVIGARMTRVSLGRIEQPEHKRSERDTKSLAFLHFVCGDLKHVVFNP